MNKNNLSEKAHANAVAKGFWHERKGNEHCLMLVVTEVAEMVEADRKGHNADKFGFDTAIANAHKGVVRDDWFAYAFNRCIKNTLEDEFADVAIRLADLAGALGLDFDKMQPCRYYRAFDRFTFTENAFALVKGLSKDKICIEKRIQFGLCFIEEWSKHLGINLDWHIDQKMTYNQGREAMHGKKY
jgi:NTP pyrophosphatase (non-canonical NTP hydrolase)